jgi:hypothetical protein
MSISWSAIEQITSGKLGRINAEHRLRLVQAELRCITGTPIKDEADRLRYMTLWRELDALIRARDEARP